MMAILVVIFVGMFAYGVLTAHVGAGIVSLLCAVGVAYVAGFFHPTTGFRSKDPTQFSDLE